uniref:Reverse transcriptase/retrotransposon-derived protein RNase H-like domain-containing protein n=1 Tax=Lactuca sativa TaxID=4236 RepID=A0A9R1X2N9_LACSA|nr:hypothetical protein LSAT_V11C700353660 [Lactuca sativa]
MDLLPFIVVLSDIFNGRGEANKSFEKIKHKLTTTPLLVLPNFNKLFTLKCDASIIGIGVVYPKTINQLLSLVKILVRRDKNG